MSDTIVVTREYLLSLLDAWQQNKITTAEIYETAKNLKPYAEVLDWENGEDFSVTMEVLDDFDSLNMNFITQDDIEAYKEFLHTPLGSYEQGDKKLKQYISSINREERMKKLSGHYPYIDVNS